MGGLVSENGSRAARAGCHKNKKSDLENGASMKELGLVALRRCKCLPPALTIALFGLMAPFTTASASQLHLPPPTPEPTELTSTLSSSSASGRSITVTEGPRVRDTATLTGPNAASAHGKVIYTLYSDSACTLEMGKRGSTRVVFGSIDPSIGARLPAGTHECSAITGQAHDVNERDRDSTVFNLPTDLSDHQRFAMHWQVGQRVRL
jgi:hypothetical protein